MSGLWEAITGKPARPDEDEWEKTQKDFMRIFGGITPGHGQVNVSHAAHSEQAADYYKNQGYNVTPEYLRDNTHVPNRSYASAPPTQQPAQQDVDKLISKALNLDFEHYPTGDKWMFEQAKNKLGSLTENQRNFLTDPNISDAQKVVMLEDWLRPKTLDEVHQWAAERRKDLDAAGGGMRAFGGPRGYAEYLKEHEKGNVSNIYAKNWQSTWDKNLKKYGMTPTKENYYNPSYGPPTDEPWAMENILANAENYKNAGGGSAWAWDQAQNYKRQGGYEGWLKRWDESHPDIFDIDQWLNSSSPETGGANQATSAPPQNFAGYGSYSGHGYGGGSYGGSKTGGPLPPMQPFSYDSLMTDILNQLQTTGTYKPLQKSLDVLMNPYKSTEGYKEQLGAVLNQLSKRGVVNSSLTDRILERLNKDWMERARELQTRGVLAGEGLRQAEAAQRVATRNLAADIALRKYLGDMSSWLRNKEIDLNEAFRRDSLAEDIRRSLWQEAFNATKYGDYISRQRWLDEVGALKDVTGIEEGDWKRALGSYASLDEALRNDDQAAFKTIFDLWHTMLTSRYGVPSTTMTSSKGNPFLSLIAPIISEPIANAGSQIGSWVQGQLGNIFGGGPPSTMYGDTAGGFPGL